MIKCMVKYNKTRVLMNCIDIGLQHCFEQKNTVYNCVLLGSHSLCLPLQVVWSTAVGNPVPGLYAISL